jgi:hypothetical protein
VLDTAGGMEDKSYVDYELVRKPLEPTIREQKYFNYVRVSIFLHKRNRKFLPLTWDKIPSLFSHFLASMSTFCSFSKSVVGFFFVIFNAFASRCRPGRRPRFLHRRHRRHLFVCIFGLL